MKKLVAAAASVAVAATAVLSSCAAPTPSVPTSLKILFIGNSFAVDTMEHVADIAADAGVEEIKLNVLYIGGCSINRHYRNITDDLRIYELFENTGSGWTSTAGKGIQTTVESDEWDVIAIQHGTADGSRYAEEESYENLPALVQEIKAIAPEHTKIVFNMTWVGDANSHEEMIAFGNNQQAYYRAVASLTEQTVVPIEGIDIVCPTGTAIQNTRAMKLGVPLTRDKYHLSLALGRYVAGLTFFGAVTGADISDVAWMPTVTDEYGNTHSVTDDQRVAAINAAKAALETPFAVTEFEE